MSTPTTNAELVTLIRAERAEFEALLGRLSEEQLTRPGVESDWAVKDILAHLTFWEQSMLRRLQAVVHGKPPERLQVAGEDWLVTMDRINDQNFTANRERPLSEVQANFRRSHQQAMAFIETIADADLAESSPAAQLLGRPLQDLIAGDTYEHYREHGDTIRKWLAKQ